MMKNVENIAYWCLIIWKKCALFQFAVDWLLGNFLFICRQIDLVSCSCFYAVGIFDIWFLSSLFVNGLLSITQFCLCCMSLCVELEGAMLCFGIRTKCAPSSRLYLIFIGTTFSQVISMNQIQLEAFNKGRCGSLHKNGKSFHTHAFDLQHNSRHITV